MSPAQAESFWILGSLLADYYPVTSKRIFKSIATMRLFLLVQPCAPDPSYTQQNPRLTRHLEREESKIDLIHSHQ